MLTLLIAGGAGLLLLTRVPAARHNAATLLLNIALTEQPLALERRMILLESAQQLNSAETDPAIQPPAPDCLRTGDCFATQPWLLANYWLCAGNRARATQHVHDLLTARQTPIEPLGCDPWLLLLDDAGRVQLPAADAAPGWIPDITNTTSATFQPVEDTYELRFANTPASRDIAAYTAAADAIPLANFDALSVRARVAPGSFLTLDVLIDGSVQRLLGYHRGSGEWETLTLPLPEAGRQIEMVRIIANEPNASPQQPHHEVSIRWIALQPKRS